MIQIKPRNLYTPDIVVDMFIIPTLHGLSVEMCYNNTFAVSWPPPSYAQGIHATWKVYILAGKLSAGIQEESVVIIFSCLVVQMHSYNTNVIGSLAVQIWHAVQLCWQISYAQR